MDITKNIKEINEQIHHAERDYQRLPSSVKLLAVSKGHSIAAIKTAAKCGLRCFGENYIQEAIPKINSLKNYSLEWHFIGKLQSNKTKMIAENFDWLQSLDRIDLARKLNSQRPSELPPLNVCIEVNICEEQNKGGIICNQLIETAQEIRSLPNLRLRGLMTIPEFTSNSDNQFKIFKKMKQLYEMLFQQGFELDTLSMGMSHDFIAAIACGSTMVRLGQAIFGIRQPKGGIIE